MNGTKALPYPYLIKNTEMANVLYSYMESITEENGQSKSIGCGSSSQRRPSIPFFVWFELLNREIICESVTDEAVSWNDSIRDAIVSTELYQRHHCIYNSFRTWTNWKCASSNLLSLLSSAIGEYSDESMSAVRRFSSLSKHFYLITLPNGQTSSQLCITHLPMHIGQFRFSPLPLTVDQMSLHDPRHSLLHQPQLSIYNTMELCSAKYYRMLSSEHLAGTYDNLLEKYLDLAEEVVDNKTTYEYDPKVLDEKQALYNISASLSGSEGAASDILRAVVHRTDFFVKNNKLSGSSKSCDRFDPSKMDPSDRQRTSLLSQRSRKQLK